MKKLITGALAFACCIALAGCAGTASTAKDDADDGAEQKTEAVEQAPEEAAEAETEANDGPAAAADDEAAAQETDATAHAGGAAGGNYEETDLIGEAAAVDAALADANIKEADAANIRIELDYDDGKPYYEIDFVNDGTEYEYDINAVTGVVIESSKEPAGR